MLIILSIKTVYNFALQNDRSIQPTLKLNNTTNFSTGKEQYINQYLRKLVSCRGGLDRVVSGHDLGEGVGTSLSCGSGLKDRGGALLK